MEAQNSYCWGKSGGGPRAPQDAGANSECPRTREAFWSAQTCLRFPTARHVAPIKAATRRRTPKGGREIRLLTISAKRLGVRPVLWRFLW